MSTEERDEIMMEILRRLKRMEARTYRSTVVVRAKKQDGKDRKEFYKDYILTNNKPRRHEKVPQRSNTD